MPPNQLFSAFGRHKLFHLTTRVTIYSGEAMQLLRSHHVKEWQELYTQDSASQSFWNTNHWAHSRGMQSCRSHEMFKEGKPWEFVPARYSKAHGAKAEKAPEHCMLHFSHLKFEDYDIIYYAKHQSPTSKLFSLAEWQTSANDYFKVFCSSLVTTLP